MRRPLSVFLSALGAVAVVASGLGATAASADDVSDPKAQRQRAAAAAKAEHAGASAFAAQATGSAVTPWSGSPEDLEELAASLFEDDGIEIRNVGYTGAPAALGSYEGLPTGVSATEDGVILSTGLAIEADTVSFASTDLQQPGDAQLSALSGGETYDAAILEFEFQVSEPGIRFEFQFASEEWPSWVGQGFNDVFALTINGSNCALTPGGQPISVDDSGFSPSPPGITYSGITAVTTCNRLVASAPAWNRARFAIADTGDEIYDSAVLIAAFRRDIPPLIFAHGWTSSASAWDPAVALLSQVADIDAREDDRIEIIGSTPANTVDAWASIEDNAQVIIGVAQRLFDEHGQRVNVIAHSKGGLDSRLASALRPDLFDTVVMLGTPNAGSIGANDLCAMPVSFVTDKKRFGPCWREANAGLNDLRTSSMLAFNRTWASSGSVSYYTVGGDKGTVTGRNRCWNEGGIVRDQANSLWTNLFGTPEWWAYGTASPNGWDSPVCLNSLFSLSQQEFDLQADEDQQGPAHFYRHIPLGYYEGYDHSDVQVQACTLLPAFGLVLPAGTVSESTQIGQLERSCPTLHRPYGGPLVGPASAGAFSARSTAAPEQADVHSVTLLEDLASSTELTLPSAPDAPVAVIVGHDADEVRLVADGVPLAADISDLGAFQVATFPTDLPAGSTVTLEADGGTEAIVHFLVAPAAETPVLDVEVSGTQAVATVTAPGGGTVAGRLYAITADDVLLVDGAPFAGAGIATVELSLPIGEVVDVYAEVTAPLTRQLSTVAVAGDDAASAGPVVDQAVDGGRLVVTMPVSASVDAHYGASMALTDPEGRVVSTGTAIGEVADGSGTFAFTFELNAVQAAALQQPGALSFTDLTLTNISAGIAVVAQLAGPFGTLDTEVVGAPATPLLGSVGVTVDDGSVRYSIPVLAADGFDDPLLVQGQVLNPNGEVVKMFSTPVGDGPVEVALGSDELRAGSGTYLLTQLRLVNGLTGTTLHAVGSVAALYEGGDEPGDVAPVVGDVRLSPAVVAVGETTTLRADVTTAHGAGVQGATFEVRGADDEVVASGPLEAVEGAFGDTEVTVGGTLGPLTSSDLLEVCVQGLGASGTAGAFTCTDLVVVDLGGSVTAGGWFDVPAGALASDADYTGRAHLTVSARYHPNRRELVGNTQFWLHGGGARLRSTSAEWLAVSRDAGTAVLRGSGELDGQAGYRYQMWLRASAGGTSQVRVRVLAPDGSVYFDNGSDGPFGTALGGGNIAVR